MPRRWLTAAVSEGPPGLRLLYNPDFYACYVRDPDGNKLAVVCRGFTAPQAYEPSPWRNAAFISSFRLHDPSGWR